MDIVAMSKRVLYFDEEKEAERILKEGFPNGSIDFAKMFLVSKYFKKKKGITGKRLEEEIIQFCKQCDKSFNPITQHRAIASWIRSAMRYDLRKIDSVWITKKEVDLLSEVEDAKSRKVLFTLLVLARAVKKSYTRREKEGHVESSRYYIKNSYLPDVVRLVGMSRVTITQVCYVIYDYKHLFGFYPPEREVTELLYADHYGEPYFEIKDLENVSKFYNIMFAKKDASCPICNKPFTKASNSQKYCDDCAEEARATRMRKYMQKYRKSKESEAETP